MIPDYRNAQIPSNRKYTLIIPHIPKKSTIISISYYIFSE